MIIAGIDRHDEPGRHGRRQFYFQSAGWLEGGLTIGYEKFVMDTDRCGVTTAVKICGNRRVLPQFTT